MGTYFPPHKTYNLNATLTTIENKPAQKNDRHKEIIYRMTFTRDFLPELRPKKLTLEIGQQIKHYKLSNKKDTNTRFLSAGVTQKLLKSDGLSPGVNLIFSGNYKKNNKKSNQALTEHRNEDYQALINLKIHWTDQSRNNKNKK